MYQKWEPNPVAPRCQRCTMNEAENTQLKIRLTTAEVDNRRLRIDLQIANERIAGLEADIARYFQSRGVH